MFCVFCECGDECWMCGEVEVVVVCEVDDFVVVYGYVCVVCGVGDMVYVV